MNENIRDTTERLAGSFAGKCNVCTHAGIYNLAIPVFTISEKLYQSCLEAERLSNGCDAVIGDRRRAVIRSYEALRNELTR